ADSRMCTHVPPQVDALDCLRDARDEGRGQFVLAAYEREDGTVVIRVGVDVEHPGVLCERRADRLDRCVVAALAEVWYRLERQHLSYSRNRWRAGSERMKEYYDARAPEYDDWYLGRGRFAERDRPGWEAEIDELVRVIEHLPPQRTLDVACGTGFLT